MIWILSILKLSAIIYKMVLEVLKNIFELYKKMRKKGKKQRKSISLTIISRSSLC